MRLAGIAASQRARDVPRCLIDPRLHSLSLKSMRNGTSHDANAKFVSTSMSDSGCFPVKSRATKTPVLYSSTLAS